MGDMFQTEVFLHWRDMFHFEIDLHSYVLLQSCEEITILDKAERLSRQAHLGQERKNGNPYINHIEDVVLRLGDDRDAKIVGWLHDVLEDSDLTSDKLISEGIPAVLVKEVQLLTKRREQTYSQYIDIVKTSSIAIKVKKADIISNLSDNPSNKQIVKMAKALIQLCAE